MLEMFTSQNQDIPVDVSLPLLVAELVMSKNLKSRYCKKFSCICFSCIIALMSLSEIFHLGSLTPFLFLILYDVLMALNNCNGFVN